MDPIDCFMYVEKKIKTLFNEIFQHDLSNMRNRKFVISRFHLFTNACLKKENTKKNTLMN